MTDTVYVAFNYLILNLIIFFKKNPRYSSVFVDRLLSCSDSVNLKTEGERSVVLT